MRAENVMAVMTAGLFGATVVLAEEDQDEDEKR